MNGKKQISIILAAVFTMLLMLSSKSMAKTAVVNTDTLNLRKEASTDSNMLALLNMGDKLEVLDESGDWYKVKVDNKAGYVHKDYVKVQEEKSTENETNTQTSSESKTETETETNNEEDEQESNEETNTVVNEEKTETQTNENKKADNSTKDEYSPKQVKTIKDAKCYILPLINSNILSSIKKNTTITINNEVNGWLYIETEEISGWITSNSVDLAALEEDTNSEEEEKTKDDEKNNEKTEDEEKTNSEDEINVKKISEKTMYVNDNSIYVRKGPGTNYKVVDSLVLNAAVIITGEVEDWYQVKVENTTGFIAKRLLSSSKTEDTTSRGSEERTKEESKEAEETASKSSNTSKGQEIVNYAKQYLNCKYVYGGSGPSTFDCSGFTMYVYKHFGVSLSHSATAQSKIGKYVAKENLQAGDLVFFKDYQTMDGIGHCGIYIGNGNFIHASSGSGYCVKISTLTSGSYLNRYATARRIF